MAGSPSLWVATREQKQDRSPGLLPKNNRRRPRWTLHVAHSRLLTSQVVRYVGRRRQETGEADHQTVGLQVEDCVTTDSVSAHGHSSGLVWCRHGECQRRSDEPHRIYATHVQTVSTCSRRRLLCPWTTRHCASACDWWRSQRAPVGRRRARTCRARTDTEKRCPRRTGRSPGWPRSWFGCGSSGTTCHPVRG